jgi:hypothetical protein
VGFPDLTQVTADRPVAVRRQLTISGGSPAQSNLHVTSATLLGHGIPYWSSVRPRAIPPSFNDADFRSPSLLTGRLAPAAGALSMTNVSINDITRDAGTLDELNARYARTKARLAAARGADDEEAQAAATAKLVELDEAIGTILATLALRNAELARLRQVAA